MVMPVIHDVFTITHQFSINYITLNLQVPLPLLAPELYLLPCTTAAAKPNPNNGKETLRLPGYKCKSVNGILNQIINCSTNTFALGSYDLGWLRGS